MQSSVRSPEPQEPVERFSHGPTNNFIPFPKAETEQSIPARFGQQVRRFPYRLAVKGSAHSITYRHLDRFANRIARAILSMHGEGEATVGLVLQKDAPLFAALLGTLKAGKLYIPLDPSHPRTRTFQILEDAQARLIITDSTNYAAAAELASGSRAVLNIDKMDLTLSDDDPSLALPPDAPAYVIYTSGSTGEPKGVVQNHRNVLHNTMIHTNNLHISCADRLSLLASIGTAQAATAIYSALLNGAALCPFDVKEGGLSRLGAWLNQEEISIYHSSASIYRSLFGAVKDATFPHLRLIKVGGEQVFSSDLELYKRHFSPTCIFVNSLSSTETGTVRQIGINKDTIIHRDIVPVGFPVEDTEVLLMDENGHRVSPGVPGEIVIKSRYLFPGYWHRPDLTQRAFLSDPEGGGSRIYRTGDLGRLSANGCLEYLGRKDLRVKVRGFGVEVAEIEAVLLNRCQIKHAAVIARRGNHGATHLEAYVVPGGGPAPNAASLRAAMKNSLPDHMVPSLFFTVGALPLTPSGKVDRHSLHPGLSIRSKSRAHHKKPESPLEWQIVKIWEELLETEPIGVQEDFFELGGDSLLALQMLYRVETECGVKLPVSAMFDDATIERLADSSVNANRVEFTSPFVVIQEGSSDRPFFFLHGDFSHGGFYCRKLARHMGREHTFIAIHPHGLDGEPVPSTIEEMAADRLRILLELQPSGPYLLGGHCNGGLVAFEMARQLGALGMTVESLVIVDASPRNARYKGLRKWIKVLGCVLRWEHREQVNWFYRVQQYGIRWTELSREGRRAQILFLLEKMRNFAKKVSKRAKPRPVDQAIPSDALNRQERWHAIHYAVTGYVPRPYEGRVTLLRTASFQTRFPGDPNFGWGRVASSVEVVPIPGDHLSCLTGHASSLAQCLATCLWSKNTGVGKRL